MAANLTLQSRQCHRFPATIWCCRFLAEYLPDDGVGGPAAGPGLQLVVADALALHHEEAKLVSNAVHQTLRGRHTWYNLICGATSCSDG